MAEIRGLVMTLSDYCYDLEAVLPQFHHGDERATGIEPPFRLSDSDTFIGKTA